MDGPIDCQGTDLNPEVLSAILDVCTTTPQVRRLWLFGSRARGDAGRLSDIDLAVEAPEAGPREWDALWFRLTEELPTLLAVDVVRMEQASTRLRRRILEEGVLLHDAT